MKSHAVFLIDEEMIKFLQVSIRNKKIVTGVDVVDIKGQSDAQISQSLKSFLKQQTYRFTQSRVSIVVPRSRVILRLMTFPSLDPEEIRSMLNLQIGSSIPYSREEIELDFHIISRTKDGYANVVVVVIPQEIAVRYARIFTDANIKVEGMTVSSIGLWLFCQQQNLFLDKSTAIIDIDKNHSEILIADKGQWYLSRELPLGFGQIEENASEEMLRQWDLTLTNSGNKCLDNLEFIYVGNTDKQSQSLESGLTKRDHRVSVKGLILTKILVTARGLRWPKIFIEEGGSFISLAGIALSSQLPPVNLMPKSVQKIQHRKQFQRQLLVLVFWVMAALLALAAVLGQGTIRKNLILAQLDQELDVAKQEAFNVESQWKKIQDIENMIKNRLIFSKLASSIYHLLPSGIYLSNINISSGVSLALQGVASNSSDINQFQKSMVASPYFFNVSLDYVNKRVTSQGELDYFKITATLKNVSGHS